MHNYIEELRNKPDHHKKRVALGAAFAITASMFVAWISVILPSNTNQIIAQSNDNIENTASSQSASANTPFQDLKNTVSAGVTSIKSMFKKSDNFDFQGEYTKMKDQVQSGEIKLTPESDQNGTNDPNTNSATE